MQIGRTGWDTPIKRDADFGNGPASAPIYVQGPFGDQTNFPVNYEYSGDAPARLQRTIDSLLYGPYNRQNFISLFYALPEIFAPVHEIASRVADATYQLRAVRTEKVIDNDETFNRLFTQPNPLMAFKQFVYQSVCYEILTGASLSYLNVPSLLDFNWKSILSWSNIPTQQTSMNKKEGVDPFSATSIDDYINYYQANNRTFKPDRVINLTNHDLLRGNAVDGFVSPLIGAKLAIRNLLPVYEARGVIFIKRGALGFIVSKKSDESGMISLTPKEKEEVNQEYANSYGLTGNKNTIGVTSSPVEFVRTAMSIKELQPFDETLADALAIYATLRVPRHLCPSKEQSTYANADADMKSFYEDTIIPIANRYTSAWSNKFNIPNRYIYADFSNVGILQENKKEKVTVEQIQGNVYLQRFLTGVGTLNQWIISTGNDASTNPIYDKLLFDMEPDELEKIKSVLNIKTVSTGTPSKTGAPEKPAIEEENGQSTAA